MNDHGDVPALQILAAIAACARSSFSGSSSIKPLNTMTKPNDKNEEMQKRLVIDRGGINGKKRNGKNEDQGRLIYNPPFITISCILLRFRIVSGRCFFDGLWWFVLSIANAT
jgi:hypothetical protein